MNRKRILCLPSKYFEEKFDDMAKQGIELNDYERNNYRLELIRMNEKERIRTIR